LPVHFLFCQVQRITLLRGKTRLWVSAEASGLQDRNIPYENTMNFFRISSLLPYAKNCRYCRLSICRILSRKHYTWFWQIYYGQSHTSWDEIRISPLYWISRASPYYYNSYYKRKDVVEEGGRIVIQSGTER